MNKLWATKAQLVVGHEVLAADFVGGTDYILTTANWVIPAKLPEVQRFNLLSLPYDLQVNAAFKEQ